MFRMLILGIIVYLLISDHVLSPYLTTAIVILIPVILVIKFTKSFLSLFKIFVK